MQEVDTWQGHWLGSVDVQRHSVTLICTPPSYPQHTSVVKVFLNQSE